MKLVFKESYSKQETNLVISQIDYEISVQRKNIGNQSKRRKHIGSAYIKARIQDLENWKMHYRENTI